MNKYQQQKEKIRECAINWQQEIMNDTKSPSLDELVNMQVYFEKLAKKFGLIKEFKENGII